MIPLTVLACFLAASTFGVWLFIMRFLLHPLRQVPGPQIYAASSWRLAYDDLKGRTTREVHKLHHQYGSVVRIGPAHVSFNSTPALKAIYGVGSRSQRTPFYKLFEPYGWPTMFTMASGQDHHERKQRLARVYAKNNIFRGSIADMIEVRVDRFLRFTDEESSNGVLDIASGLSFFSLDVATAFVYGSRFGTDALTGNETDRKLLSDYGHSSRREVSWLAVHGSSRLKMSVLGGLCGVYLGNVDGSAPFTCIRSFATETFERCNSLDGSGPGETQQPHDSLIAQLCSHHKGRDPLSDIDVASECADHLLAAIETTRNLLLFLIWVLSLPENARCQTKLRQELHDLGSSDVNGKGLPTVEAADRLPYLNAVLREALRLYAPLPALQPRLFDFDTMIEGYLIPANTTVSMSPYSLHRNADVFEDPHAFNPDRWLFETDPEMRRWWWPFSSGGRMCTGLQ